MTFARILVVLAAALLSAQALAASSCDSLEDCIAGMRTLAQSALSRENSLTPEEVEVTDRVAEFDEAVPRLVPLLTSPDRQLAKLASVSLANASRIDAKYFPQIIAGLDRGLGWLPPALCAMPGEAPAREAVKRFLVSKSAPENQEAFAVVRCGLRALPFIANAARCTSACPRSTHANLAHVLHEMDPKISSAIGYPLMEIARDTGAPDDTVRGVLIMIGALGKSAAYLQKELLDLRSTRTALSTSIDATLVELHANNAGRIAARRLREMNSAFGAGIALRDIAELGADGRDAGEEVVRILTGDNWNSRLAAARALGFIDYQAAVPLLIQAITEPTDVRLNWVAVQSLGRLRNKAAVVALQRAASGHWYSPVRRAATEALIHIREGTPYERQYHPDNFPFEFFAYEHIAEPRDECRALAIPLLAEAQARNLRATSDGISTLGYKKSRTVTQNPQMALRVADGWMTGTNNGEWGGELVFIGDDRSQRVLLEQNVHDIFKLGQRIIALTGLAHLGSNNGMVYELRQDAAGMWGATPWRALPGAPRHSRLVDTGELAIDVHSGGSILIAPEGSMRMACGAK